MNDTTRINFDAPATLRKWPSLNGERIVSSEGARPYLIVDGTLGDCIQQFMAKPASQHQLDETDPQGDLVPSVVSAKLILEIARLRDYL